MLWYYVFQKFVHYVSIQCINFFSPGECDHALLDDPNKIKNFQFSASGHVNDGHEAFQARFSNLQIWCEDGAKNDAYIQVDIGGLIRIIAVATQGDTSHFNAWVTSYNVLYSTNSASWTTVTVTGKQVR